MSAAHLSITHTAAEGTVLMGTSRGDGARDVLREAGWRWGRTVGGWYVPRSRETSADVERIEATAEALRASGFTVTVEVDQSPATVAEVEQRRAQRSATRAEALHRRAQREQAKADQADAAAAALRERVAGQPILTGHHSQARGERDAQRTRDLTRASIEHQSAADEAQRAAGEAEAATGARHHPVTVWGRIERLRAEVRKLERDMGRIQERDNERWFERARERHARAVAELDHWQGVRAAQIAEGTACDASARTVRVGDLVEISDRWWRVVKTNPTTVQVDTEPGHQNSAKWGHVTGHIVAPTTE